MTSRRVVVIALLVGVVAWGSAAAIPWARQEFYDELSGPVTMSVSGSTVVALLWPAVFVVIAGFAATALGGRWLQRSVGTVIAVIGLAVLAVTITSLLRGNSASSLSYLLPRPATPISDVIGLIIGPVIALLGSVTVVFSGILLVRGAQSAKASVRGVRYQAPAARRAHIAGHYENSADSAAAPAAVTPDGGLPDPRDDVGSSDQPTTRAHHTVDFWQAIDAGFDPTVGPTAPAEPAPDTMKKTFDAEHRQG